ncbi:L-alanine-DL-glutamate epimerase-like enolase superfamily enzyme [Streptosporangium becharense]|uniref:Dipeptide epimerase n=1 Tax=Streptosporangium becharense TaxID=1816182 RepID=A0A7W9IH08_9ACTN|nr:dipeptide epimerase [Streptosporangium becharense]MBB2914793.1 L-alanine-DL-glutamate epimerase-like enolase superfamily enzyme [Streptosporangium becharense]MBB5820396.1 L-alanine-DL-glutamate epimerase-like enolase superfamily enzyme [Streptosporangium becharense]
MKLTWSVVPLPLREPFRISRSVMSTRDAVQLVLHHDGVSGYGEIVTSAYYGLDVPGIVAALTGLPACPDPETLLAELPDLPYPPGVLAGLDAAAFDLMGKRDGLPVHRLAGHPEWRPVPTAYTIGICDPSRAGETARDLGERGFTVLKVKLGSPDEDDDVARVAAVRAAVPGARLLLDPNGAWTAEQAVRILERMPYADAVEQPVPPGRPDLLAWVSERSPTPVIADEDAVDAADVERLAGAVAGVNVKVAKCGGVRAALRVIDAARGHGMNVMLGCLVASSLGVAPAAHLAGHARWTDLDGHLLLARDPWTGIGGEDGVLRLSGRPGLGVRRAEETGGEENETGGEEGAPWHPGPPGPGVRRADEAG